MNLRDDRLAAQSAHEGGRIAAFCKYADEADCGNRGGNDNGDRGVAGLQVARRNLRKRVALEETIGVGRLEEKLHSTLGEGEALVSRIDGERFIKWNGDTVSKGGIAGEGRVGRVFGDQPGVCGGRKKQANAEGQEEVDEL